MIAILGAGSWAAALAIALHRKGLTARIWSPFDEEAERLRTTRRLPHKLPGIVLPPETGITSDMEIALDGAEAVLAAVPSEFFRDTMARLAEHLAAGILVVACTKGVEPETCLTMSQIAAETLSPDCPIAALSGPSHAEEVSRGMPTAIVAASVDEETAIRTQELLQQPTFRVYTNADILGVELGGALKNVIAIATGVADGLGYGDNARAALITRGLAEITRVGVAAGAQEQTFAGLSGLGDLVVTCTSRHSRNRRLGELLAQGYDLAAAREELGMVAEGAHTVRAISTLQSRYGVETPISEEVRSMLFEGLSPSEAVKNLLSRSTKSE